MNGAEVGLWTRVNFIENCLQGFAFRGSRAVRFENCMGYCICVTMTQAKRIFQQIKYIPVLG